MHPWAKGLWGNGKVSPIINAMDSMTPTVLGLIAGWIEDYNDTHQHSGLKMRSPPGFIAAQTATA